MTPAMRQMQRDLDRANVATYLRHDPPWDVRLLPILAGLFRSESDDAADDATLNPKGDAP